MLELDQVSPVFSVILAVANSEAVRLLAVILDGFGYDPVECQTTVELVGYLARTTPFAAIIDARLEQAQAICEQLRERGGVSLLLLVDGAEPEEQARAFGADGWAPANASPEEILTHLRIFAVEKIEPSQVSC
jgi:DNA-binding response OmpR family regulator